MPRKDPITGCMVMTLPEFLNDEAAREGKGRSGGDIMEDFIQDMKDDDRRMEEQYKDPAFLLKELQRVSSEYVSDWNISRDEEGSQSFPDESRPPYPVEVINVLESHHHQSFRSSRGSIVAVVRCDTGCTKTCRLSFYHDSGDRMNPPDSEEELEWDYKPQDKTVSQP